MRIGKILATEKVPTTVDEFYFWTDKELIIKPFDVVKVKHIKDSVTFGMVEEISHLTDSSSFLAGYISSDFGDVNAEAYTQRIGMNYVKARVVANDKNIYTPVLDGFPVSLANADDVKEALGLKNIDNKLPCGYIEMYEAPNNITIPVHFNSHFLIGPEGAHLNISGISGLASKTSYAMFLLKAIQDQYLVEKKNGETVAFVILNVKGRDLLAIDESNKDLTNEDKKNYKMLDMGTEAFQNVKYFYPSGEKSGDAVTHSRDFKDQMTVDKAFIYKYRFKEDRESLGMLFANVDDPQGTMDSIVTLIENGDENFNSIDNWVDLLKELKERCEAGKKNNTNNTITVASWRKFYRIFNKAFNKSSLFHTQVVSAKKEVQLSQAIKEIRPNETFVVDIAKLDEETQGFVFGDVMKAVNELKLGQMDDREEKDIPSKIIIFIDELNKYASNDVPKNSPILRQLLDITERGRSLGIILFSAEQFKSDIHHRIKGNCATHAYGRTNAIEVSKPDYQYVPSVYKSMLTRLKQGEYILQNPIFRSLLNIKFPKPLYKQYKNG